MKKIGGLCKIDSCNNKYHGNGYCSAHNHRLARYGNPIYIPSKKTREEIRSSRNDIGRHMNYNGYWLILCPCHPNADKKGYMLEHRLVTEVKIGRFLDSHEIIHHIDSDRGNNNLNNLLLTNNVEHLSFHNYKLRR